jgi:glycine cleavage system protein P-like pyridoxal-binding family
MSFLPEIAAEYLRDLSELASLTQSSAIGSLNLSIPLIQSEGNTVQTAAQIAQVATLPEFNTNLSDAQQQAALSVVYDLQQRVCALTGFSEVSLTASNAQQAIFACLSMIKKYQQKNNLRNKLLLCNVVPDVEAIAQKLQFQVVGVVAKDLIDSIDDECAAVVISFPEQREGVGFAQLLRAKLNEYDVQLYLDGSHQFFFPFESSLQAFQADVLHLDLAYICGITKGANAVCAGNTMQNYLPIPIAHLIDGGYVWKKINEKPLSIGTVNSTLINLQSILHCLVYLRLQGNKGISQQAVVSIVIAQYLQKKLRAAGIEVKQLPPASGHCEVLVTNIHPDATALQSVLNHLNTLPIGVEVNFMSQGLHITLSLLDQLNAEQLQSLIEMFILRL